MVGYADAQCATGAALAGDDADDGGAKPGHFQKVAGNRLGLAAFLGTDAGIGAGGVDERDDRKPEFLGQLHAAEGFAVSLGVGEAEVTADLFLGITPLVMANEHDLVAAHAGQAAADGGVVAEGAIAMKFTEIAAGQLDVIVEQRPLRMPGDLDGFPGGEVLVGLSEQGGVVGAKLAKLFRIIDSLLRLESFQFLYLRLQSAQRLFEVEGYPGDDLFGFGESRRGSHMIIVRPV
jgi:hypothetical protein